MTGLSLPRRWLKHIHPEGIPWPGSAVYNLASSTRVFQRHYALVADDIAEHCAAGDLLDIGTGPGWLLLALRKAHPRLTPAGLDVSPAMVAKARVNMARAGLSETIRIVEAKSSSLPYPDEAFDIVVSTGSIHHWKEPAAGLTEIYRVLKPGCPALLYDIVSDTPAPVFREAARHFGPLQMWLLWLHAFTEPFYSRQAYEELIQGTPFRHGETRFVGVLCCLRLRKPSLEEMRRAEQSR
jgi:ubiquinone/menaquinone biosynthesis C-methylase UbiE